MSNIYRVSVGRLVEVRLGNSVRTPEDVDDWFNGVGAAMRTLPSGARAVVCADWRACPLLSGEAAERARIRLTQVNPLVERSAALASAESAITVLQFLRVIRESHHPSRSLFTEIEPMIAWLTPVLTPAEAERLRAFINEYAGPPAHALPANATGRRSDWV